MAAIPGYGVALSIDGDDLSVYSNSVTFTRTVEALETTAFGSTNKTFIGGLGDSTGTVEGHYDSTAVTGPGAIFRALVAAKALVVFMYRPEGTGSAKPEAEVSVLVTSYEESAEVAGLVTWSAELQGSGAVNDTPQS